MKNNNNQKGKILAVDDEERNLRLAEDILEDEGYEVLLAKNGKEGLRLAEEEQPDVILLDIMMPGIDGFEVCRRLKATGSGMERIKVIMVTAKAQTDDTVAGHEAGADDYATKPYDETVLLARVRTQLRTKRAEDEVRNSNLLLEERVKERTRDLRESQLEVVQRLGKAAEYRDPETGSHILRMAHYSATLGKAAGLSPEECELLLNAAPMHDIGKVGIADNILLKPAALTQEEFAVMKTHATISGEILADSKSRLLQMAREIALTHHEKWGGSGYPKGLIGEKIPIHGRIVAIADVFDALTSKRPYKEAWTVEKSIAEIRNTSGQHFDPNMVSLFEGIQPEILEIKARFQEE